MSRPPPLFLTGRFRSGTTMLWSLFDALPDHAAFYEPLHDNLAVDIAHTRPMASHRGVGDYWSAYRGLEDLVAARQRSDFAWDRLLLEADDDHPELQAWIEGLIEAAGERRAVLKFNRVDLRLPWLAARFPDAVIVHLSRASRPTWASMVRHLPAGSRDDGDHPDVYDLAQWALSLAPRLPFLVGESGRGSYPRHHLLWRLSGLMGRRRAQVSLAYEDIAADPLRGLAPLVDAGLLSAAQLSDAAARFSPGVQEDPTRRRGAGWFRQIEERGEHLLESLGLTEGFGVRTLHEIRAAHAPAWEALPPLDTPALLRSLLAALSRSRGDITRLLRIVRDGESGD